MTGLTNLSYLNLSTNQISDLTPLTGLTNLSYLFLSTNNVSDISSLVENTGIGPSTTLGAVDTVDLRNNQLNYVALNTHVPALQARNVALGFDTRTPTTFSMISGNNQVGTEGATLSNPFVVKVQDQNGTAFEGVPVTFSTATGNGTLSTTKTATDATGHAQATLTLSNSVPPTISILVSAADIEQTLTFKATNTSTLNIPDAQLRAALEAALGKAAGDSITPLEMKGLTELNLSIKSISDLTGLESATHLNKLQLHHNNISDITPLTGLTKLSYLSIDRNNISDITPLAGLTKLSYLSIYSNSISDITPLAGLTKLSYLSIDRNNISDITPLAGLTKFSYLIINNNQIRDISPLIENTELGQGNTLDLQRNPLSYAALNTDIPTLKERGVSVTFDDRTPTTLSLISGNNQPGKPGTPLAAPFVMEVQDQDGAVFEGVPVTFSIATGNGTLSTTQTTTDANGQAQSTLTLSNTAPVTTTVHASAVDITEPLIFNTTNPDTVNIPDANLHAAIATALGLSPDTPITHVQMKTLKDLDMESRNISDLTGLESATNLSTLQLHNNAISDITPLTTLTKLTYLILHNNDITDITPLAGLTYLDQLHINNNTSISDITPLAGLTRISSLYLHNTSISDLTPLAGLPRIRDLRLNHASITDITPLAGLTRMRILHLQNNSISDITPLAGLTNLHTLYLQNNSISDLAPLAGLTNLHTLYLQNNSISDITPLIKNTGIGNDANDVVNLANILLNYYTLYVDMPILQARAGDIIFDSRTPTTLSIISGNNQIGTAGEALPNPFIIEIQDQNSVGFEDVPVRFLVWNEEGSLSSTYPDAIDMTFTSDDRIFGQAMRTDGDGRAQATFTLGASFLNYTIYAHLNPLVSGAPNETRQLTFKVSLDVDINGDSLLDLADLGLVISNFGATVAADADPNPDVNRDGRVDGNDFLLISDAILAQVEAGGTASPPAHALSIPGVTAEMVRGWILEVKRRSNGDPRFDGGIGLLEQLLASLQPEETALLANYPNPFNPETWIPYQLAEAGKVSITIYAVNGTVIRTLDLGWMPVGTYHSQQFAAYWNGRNASGEPVASGIYFYTLTVGDFTATRKMLIRK